MISAADLWTVSYTVAGIAVVVTVAGLLVVRLMAARSVAANLTVIAAVTVLATLAGVAVTADEMFISRADFDVVLPIVAITGIAGFTVALLVGRRVARSSRLLLTAVQEVGAGGAYQPPQAVLPAELAGLSDELAAAHARLAQARDRERALEASRRELVAWVSHDLRTPLAGLRAMAEALEDGVVADRLTVSQYHRQIRRETDRLTVMIDDLFALSRIHAGALRLVRRPVELSELIGEAITSAEPLARAKGVRLRGHAAASPPVPVDPAELGRALGNLVSNAIRHTPAGGSVEVLGDEGSGMARVSVSDSCGGIPAEHLPRVFDVAFRGQPARTPGPDEGAGLGLSIARGIVEAHAGRIGVRNTGPGCQFAIWLPVAREAAGAARAGRPPTGRPPAARHRPPPRQAPARDAPARENAARGAPAWPAGAR
jgi:signal transduction histidine kinase